MPSLHEELEAASACKVCGFLRGLGLRDAREWADELALPVNLVGNMAVVRALARRGVHVTETSVRRHRSRHG